MRFIALAALLAVAGLSPGTAEAQLPPDPTTVQPPPPFDQCRADGAVIVVCIVVQACEGVIPRPLREWICKIG